MQKPEYYAAVYGIIKNEKGEILFGKRCNTGYMDGYYELPAGHIEGYETHFEALKREMKEEVGIDIQESDTKIVHICHRIRKGERVYYDIYFDILDWKGKLKNNEEDKCEKIEFLDYRKYDESQIVPHSFQAFGKIENGLLYSEINR